VPPAGELIQQVLAELQRLADREPAKMEGFHPVQVGELLRQVATGTAVDIGELTRQLQRAGLRDVVIAQISSVTAGVAGQQGVVLVGIAAAPPPVQSDSPPPQVPAAGPLPLALASGEAARLPTDMPTAVHDLIARHDRSAGLQPAAARAFLAQQIDRSPSRVTDLGSLFVWLRGRGLDDEAIHEIMLALSAVGHALGRRVALPGPTAALPPASRARLLQEFVRRCPAATADSEGSAAAATQPAANEGKLAGPPPPMFEDDYMVSVITNTLVRERRKRSVAFAGAIGGALVLALALAAAFVFETEESEPGVDLPPPPLERAPQTAAAVGSKEARARARFALRAAEKSLKSGDLAEAETGARRAKELDPALAEAAQVLSVIAQRRGQRGEACAHMKDYVRTSGKEGALKARLLATACDD